MSDIKSTIEEDASSPESVSSDAGSVSNRPLDELIEADKYLDSKDTVDNQPKRMGFRLGVFRAPDHY